MPLSTKPSIQDDALSQSSTTSHTLPKDFSYLQRPEIYHPLSQLEIPAPFRTRSPTPELDSSLSSNLARLDTLLQTGSFHPAAHLSAGLLTSPLVSPTDSATIFNLLQTRLLCLELTGNTVLAAQESKCLEDLAHTFYSTSSASPTSTTNHPPTHIVPWPLRILAVRLQAIGFGDVRRGVAGFYDLGIEARAQLKSPSLTREERPIWKARLSDLGMRVTNSLIEMGDLAAAKECLQTTHLLDDDDQEPIVTPETALRLALLLIRIGDVRAAENVARKQINVANEMEVFWPLHAMAEGRWDDAVQQWRALLDKKTGKQDEALIGQNLAVCLLYTGRLWEARALLEDLVDKGHGFHSLTFNLATIYELCHDKPARNKLALAERVAAQPKQAHLVWNKTNADFKL